MGPLAAYSIKSAILLSLLFTLYMLILSRQKRPSLSRFSLLGICIASLLLPIFQIYGAHESRFATTVDITMPTPTVTISENFTPFIYTIVAAIITAGICAGAIISLAGLIRILTLRATTVYRHGHKLRILNKGTSSPFCFCGCIYISRQDFEELPEMILTHENSHIRHRHFIDIFLGRTALTLQWWNPLAWFLVKEMQLVHEYQADDDVISAGFDSKEYQYLLLSRATGDTKYGLTSGFRHSELKQRLRMINKEKSGRATALALLMSIPASLIAFTLPTSPITASINDRFTAIDISSLRNEPRKDTVIHTDGQPLVLLDGTPLPYGELNSVNRDAIESISVWKDKPEHPNGIIEIKTKPGMDIFNTDDTQEPEGIKVIGVGAIKKTGINH